MLTDADRKNIVLNLWVARIIPVVLAGVVGYATYTVVVLLCVDYLLVKHNDPAAAIPILVVYFLLFLLMAASFFRLIWITTFTPPFVPLGPTAARDRNTRTEKHISDGSGISSGEYDPGDGRGRLPDGSGSRDEEPPGLELFYTKSVFVCEWDGKPKWCSTCGAWKPDRAHHCSSSGRCIYKMDHFCPWVGGPIGENNFKFFIQFTGYTALYCTHILVIMAIYVNQQKTSPEERMNNQFIGTLALAAFFGLFTGGMTASSIDLAVRNETQVEKLGAKSKVQLLAILKPSSPSPLPQTDQTASNFSYPEITYPLNSDSPPPQDCWQQQLPNPNACIRTPNPDPASIGHPRMPQIVPSTIDAQQSPPVLENYLPVSRHMPNGSTTATPTAIPDSNSAETRPNWPNEVVAARDLRATRTFAVLKMPQQGDNPWHLGSGLLNWKSLMGDIVLDWFLPIRRSPCCDHENDDSYYKVGPVVDELRTMYNFVPGSGAPANVARRRSKRRGGEVSTENEEMYHSKKKSKHRSKQQNGSMGSEAPIGLQDLNERV